MMVVYHRARWIYPLALISSFPVLGHITNLPECSSNSVGPLSTDTFSITCPLIVDDGTVAATGSWEPWSYPPVCVKARRPQDGKLCSYTLTSFRGGPGISFVTTPELAANSVHLLRDRDERWILNAEGQPVVPWIPPPYVIRSVAGKGLGAQANRTIHEGEIIIAERPRIMRIMNFEPWEERNVITVLSQAGNRLALDDRRRIMSMARSTGGFVLNDVINTNAFSVALGEEEHSGLFPEVARINHVCQPNTFFRFSRTALVGEVVAYKRIEKGEELSLSYLPLNLLSEDRRELITGWGFNCSCDLCSSPAKGVVSDRRRQRIQDILGMLKLAENRNPETVGRLAQETFDLCEKEGMKAQTGDFHSILARVYVSIGQRDMARKHGELAVKTLRHYAGYDSERAEGAVRFLGRLETGDLRDRSKPVGA